MMGKNTKLVGPTRQRVAMKLCSECPTNSPPPNTRSSGRSRSSEPELMAMGMTNHITHTHTQSHATDTSALDTTLPPYPPVHFQYRWWACSTRAWQAPFVTHSGLAQAVPSIRGD